LSFFLLEPGREDKNSPIKYIGAVQKKQSKKIKNVLDI
jgi:hypothetical protein